MFMAQGMGNLAIQRPVILPGEPRHIVVKALFHPYREFDVLHATNLCHYFGYSKLFDIFGYAMAKVLDL